MEPPVGVVPRQLLDDSRCDVERQFHKFIVLTDKYLFRQAFLRAGDLRPRDVIDDIRGNIQPCLNGMQLFDEALGVGQNR